MNHFTSGALLSLPLPLSIFLWAMLSSRPSRNYWITVLTYTEAMIVVKYIFQFRFYPWNVDSSDTRPLGAINIIGINRVENAASVYDLFLLLCLFLHRSILKVKNNNMIKIYILFRFFFLSFSNSDFGRRSKQHQMVCIRLLEFVYNNLRQR
jgi:hypothetical protein